MPWNSFHLLLSVRRHFFFTHNNKVLAYLYQSIFSTVIISLFHKNDNIYQSTDRIARTLLSSLNALLHWILTTPLYARSIFFFIDEETEANCSRSQSYYRWSCDLDSRNFTAEPIVGTTKTLPPTGLLWKLCEGRNHFLLNTVLPAHGMVPGTSRMLKK